MKRKLPVVCLLAVIGLHLACGASFVAAERPNQDEGWYLEAARLVEQGRVPYLDFAYVQPPLLPYVYAALGGERDMAAGRSVSLLFGALAVLLGGVAAWRLGAGAGLLAAALPAFNAFVLSQQCIVKAYALANACLALGLLLAVWAKGRRRWLAGAAVAFALAALTRNSAATALLAYWLWLAADRARRRHLLAALVAGAALPLLVYAPLALRDAGALHYNLLGHHAANAARLDPVALVATGLALTQILIAAMPALAGVVLSGLALQPGVPVETEGRDEVELVTLIFVFVAAGQLVSSHPYQEYQVLAVPPAAVLAGLCWGRVLRGAGGHRALSVLLAVTAGLVPLLALPSALANLPGRKIVVDGRRDPAGVHGPLRRVAKLVVGCTAPSDPLLTFQTAVAIEARRPLTPGLTLASFSFVDDATAERYHLLGPRRLTAELSAAQPAALVFSPGDIDCILRARFDGERFALKSGLDAAAQRAYGPVVDALNARYRLVGKVADVGQFNEEFTVFARRAGGAR